MESTDLDMGEIFDEHDDDEDIGATGVLPDLPTQTQEEGEEENAEVLARLKNLSKGAAKKVVRRPQPKLDSSRLTGDRGIPILPKLFENVKFKGKGHEAHDLSLIMRQMEHWSHRLFPKMPFDEVIERVEKLGSKGEVKTCVKKMRMDMPILDNDFIGPERDDDDEDDDIVKRGEEEQTRAEVRAEDMWDELLREEAEVTGTQDSSQPKPVQREAEFIATPLPKADNSTGGMTPDMLERIERNKKLAMERRLKKMGQLTPGNKSVSIQSRPSSSIATTAQNSLNDSSAPEKEQEMSQVDEESSKQETNSDNEMSEVLDKGPSQNVTIVDKNAQNAQNWNSGPLEQTDMGLVLDTDFSEGVKIEKADERNISAVNDNMDTETTAATEVASKEKISSDENHEKTSNSVKDDAKENSNLSETVGSNAEDMSEIIEKQQYKPTKEVAKANGENNELTDQEMSEVIEKQDKVTVVLKEKLANVGEENHRLNKDVSKSNQEINIKVSDLKVCKPEKQHVEKGLDKENTEMGSEDRKLTNSVINQTVDHGVDINMEDFDDELTEDQLMDTLES